MSKSIKKILKAGDRLQLNKTGQDSQKNYMIKLDSILDDNTLLMSIGMDEKDIKLAKKEHIVLMTLKHNKGIFYLDGVISKLKQDSEKVLVVIKLLKKIEHIQRRQYYRLNILRDIEIDILDDEEEPLHGITQNISAGGIKCVTDEPIPPGTEVKVKFSLSGDNFLIRAVILEGQSTLDNNKHVIRIMFSIISEYERQAIISSIFKIQTRNNRRLK